jgi:hypothetical protein
MFVRQPTGGLVIKYVDKALEKRIPAGFEMVINNFSLGIAGMLLCLLGFEVIGPAVLIANTFVKECIEALVHAGYLPLLSVINEPAKVLFLNNAIDQGVYYPLGMQQASVNGKSIFSMVASNPGPGLGLLLAFTLFGKGMSARSAPGAMIIHFLGGFHIREIQFVDPTEEVNNHCPGRRTLTHPFTKQGKRQQQPQARTWVRGHHKEDGFTVNRSLLHSQRIIDALIDRIIEEKHFRRFIDD